MHKAVPFHALIDSIMKDLPCLTACALPWLCARKILPCCLCVGIVSLPFLSFILYYFLSGFVFVYMHFYAPPQNVVSVIHCTIRNYEFPYIHPSFHLSIYQHLYHLCMLPNSDTLQDVLKRFHTNVKHYETTCRNCNSGFSTFGVLVL